MAGAFQQDAFQEDAFQVGVAVVVPELPSEVLGRMFRFQPPRIAFNVNVAIRQTAPAFTQSLTARINDDELVLLLI
jgi:hypothetical protein